MTVASQFQVLAFYAAFWNEIWKWRPITPEAVSMFLTRIAYFQRIRGSVSGLTENLLGVQDLKSATIDFPGFIADRQSITLRFSHAQPDLLKKLSFGIYSLVHPHDYNPQSGTWLDTRHVVCHCSDEYKGIAAGLSKRLRYRPLRSRMLLIRLIQHVLLFLPIIAEGL